MSTGDQQPEKGYFEANFASWVDACQVIENPDEKKEELREEAKNLFLSLASSDSQEAPAPTTAPALLESSLAKLLKALGPALTGSLPSRICSLSVICGAVEGCQESEITISTARLLSAFLLEQCAPIQDEDDHFGEDYAEQIRDLAVRCLSALLGCRLQTGGDQKQTIEACKLLCSSSCQGVERRCALPLEDEDAHHLTGVTGGLSTLPRSRRATCFQLLQSAVGGIEALFQRDTEQLQKKAKAIENDLASFVSFACKCLQGESDPRCLMQLLVLFHNVQVALEPLFTAAKLASFPTVAVFDAVAPYYPINFTPPPHDNHGISRSGLKGALMSVLSYFAYDGLATSKNLDTMMSLSLGLVLERLIPMDGDQSNLAVNPVEKKEALDDLDMILFSNSIASVLDCLPKGSAQQLSNALIVTHQDAAVAVTMGGTDASENKKLADSCRWLVSKIASQLEGAKDKSLWNDFVKDPVADMVSKLNSATADGRIAIAYLSSLVASGSPHTTRFVLDAGLEKTLHVLRQYTRDEETATMAAYGIGAFFSSCRVAMEKGQASGFVLHPHPVADKSSTTFQILHKTFTDPTTEESFALRHAVVVALESVLVVSPGGSFDASDQALIVEVVSNLALVVLAATDKNENMNNGRIKFAMASANALGSLMGTAMQIESDDDDSNSSKPASIMKSKQVQEVLRSKVMVDLLFRSKQGLPNGTSSRFDRIALARACSSGYGSATLIVESLLHTLRDALATHSTSRSLDCAVALSHVLKHGGEVAARAFHELKPPGVTSQDVIDKLCDLDPRRERTKDSHADKTISSLDLPATVEELQKVQDVRQEIAFLLLPAYKSWVPKDVVMNTLSMVAKILPPLSNQDIIRLSLLLPLLAEMLENGNLPSRDEAGASESALNEFVSIRNDLASYALTGDDSRARSAAATCLLSYIVHLAQEEGQQCPAEHLLEAVVMPALVDASRNLGKGSATSIDALEKVVDCLNLASIIGSAAANRGGISVSTADKVAAFLVKLACTNRAAIPFVKGDNEIDFTSMKDTAASATVGTNAAAAFGSLLCDKRPLWTQRMTHKSLKLLEPSLILAQDGHIKTMPEYLGFVTVLCHIVCTGSLKSANLQKRGEVVKCILQSLDSGILTACEGASRISSERSQVKRLVIASILKLSHASPGLLSSHTEALVIGLMRTYASTADSDPFSDIACKLLILQVMERLCHMELRKKTLHAIMPVITSILGAAMNHPSRLLREAAVTVGNTWYTLP